MKHQDYISLGLGLLVTVQHMRHMFANQYRTTGITYSTYWFGDALRRAMDMKLSSGVDEIIVISAGTGKHIKVITTEDDALDALFLSCQW